MSIQLSQLKTSMRLGYTLALEQRKGKWCVVAEFENYWNARAVFDSLLAFAGKGGKQ